MPRNPAYRDPRFVAAALVALASLVGIAVILTGMWGDARERGRDRDRAAGGAVGMFSVTPAAAPFAAFGETRAGLDDRCLRVLVADTEEQRVRGLRDVRELGPYGGMLFVFPEDVRVWFTMANTPTPLDITWFAADGAPVDRTTMTPCPEGDDESCPRYESDAPYRYALETPAGSGASGSLGTCG